MIYFSSDWHLGETRITKEFNPFFRPFKSVEEQNECIINNMNSLIKEGDTLIHLGDVAMTVEDMKLLDNLVCKNRILIEGNYDVDKPEKRKELEKYFDKIVPELKMKINGLKLYLNHYPTKCNMKSDRFNICGHIHGLWKVQPNMVNVGIDAWNFLPVSFDDIKFVKNAIENHYDDDVFPLLVDKKKKN